ncbi:predicted protein [Naegleria gruberi]|uniref:Predicted protein n=1 Tax=Naegleria gruberi TaxID=5762 RepID=D2VWF9_NAEGR|nr:uncharacterized protein NAEGRDRAFT_81479 [Naegleria gruberi]EFC38830.1 predicted protein [Naegleria gruberi]|eukprot:XP_002671574.1 predicted protein [Naegleria gruberi strain NEG-M]
MSQTKFSSYFAITRKVICYIVLSIYSLACLSTCGLNIGCAVTFPRDCEFQFSVRLDIVISVFAFINFLSSVAVLIVQIIHDSQKMGPITIVRLRIVLYLCTTLMFMFTGMCLLLDPVSISFEDLYTGSCQRGETNVDINAAAIALDCLAFVSLFCFVFIYGFEFVNGAQEKTNLSQ